MGGGGGGGGGEERRQEGGGPGEKEQEAGEGKAGSGNPIKLAGTGRNGKKIAAFHNILQ